MPRPTQPAEHAILGLLYFEEGGGHGYDLARHFGDDQPLGDVLKLEPGMLYHHLKKLGRTGWVTVDVEPQGTRPPRQVYTLTEDGKTELLRWLREPVHAHSRNPPRIPDQALLRPPARSRPRRRSRSRSARQEPRNGIHPRNPPRRLDCCRKRLRPPGPRPPSSPDPCGHQLAGLTVAFCHRMTAKS